MSKRVVLLGSVDVYGLEDTITGESFSDFDIDDLDYFQIKGAIKVLGKMNEAVVAVLMGQQGDELYLKEAFERKDVTVGEPPHPHRGEFKRPD